MQGTVSYGVIDVDNEVCIRGQLILEQRLYTARVEEEVAVFMNTSQLGQSTCHIGHYLQMQTTATDRLTHAHATGLIIEANISTVN